MARREIKLPYTEKRMVCPHCRADLIFGTVMGTITLSNRRCPKCGKELTFVSLFTQSSTATRMSSIEIERPKVNDRSVQAW